MIANLRQPQLATPSAANLVTRGTLAGKLEYIDKRLDTSLQQAAINLFENDILKIGRDPQSEFSIDNDTENYVSRNHCEVYVVMYYPRQHYVYVRDRGSLNGTYVNDKLIGSVNKPSPGYLLSDSDVIEIKPYWELTFRQTFRPPENPLTQLQIRECQFFKGRYHVTPRSVGHGTEGVAHLAEDVFQGKQIVCKLIAVNALQGDTERDRIRRALQEADTLRQLSHPNVLGFIDAMCSPYTVYTFMELASGGDLWSFISRHGEVKEFDARIIMRQLTRGLRYLHDKGIIHRDLKPENILLANSPRIEYQRVMLSDFGACLVPNRHRMTSQVGTPLYQAPEITRKVLQTPAVDIWSLGIITMVILLGLVDYVTDMPQTEQGTLTKFVLATLQRSQRKISHKGQDFIVRCIQINPANRQTSEEADRDVWFCTPEEHLAFFHRLDKRMVSEFTHNGKIRPIPMDIPDFVPEITGQLKPDVGPAPHETITATAEAIVCAESRFPIHKPQLMLGALQDGLSDGYPSKRARTCADNEPHNTAPNEGASLDIDFKSQIVCDLESIQYSKTKESTI